MLCTGWVFLVAFLNVYDAPSLYICIFCKVHDSSMKYCEQIYVLIILKALNWKKWAVKFFSWTLSLFSGKTTAFLQKARKTKNFFHHLLKTNGIILGSKNTHFLTFSLAWTTQYMISENHEFFSTGLPYRGIWFVFHVKIEMRNSFKCAIQCLFQEIKNANTCLQSNDFTSLIRLRSTFVEKISYCCTYMYM